jgi:hypothetical protein
MKPPFLVRLRAASLAASIHLAISLLIALCAAVLVWWVWYPPPFDRLSGGRDLFLLIVAVDVICGPALTLVVFDRMKPRSELVKDLSLIGVLQCAALVYGLWSTFEARPLYLVHEVERFRVIAKPDYLGVNVADEIAKLPKSMRPSWFSGPVLVGSRPPEDPKARSTVLMEALRGGRDFVQRPEYYLPYDDAYALQAIQRAHPLEQFVNRYPAKASEAEVLLNRANLRMKDALLLPMVQRGDWIAVLNARGHPIGFMQGDGFATR